MDNDNNLNESEQIVQDIKDRKKITSGKYSVVIDGKTYVMHRDGGDYGYVPPYPKNLDGSNCTHTNDTQDNEQVEEANFTKPNTKIINGKVYVLQHDCGLRNYVRPYPKHLDGGTCSQKIEDNSQDESASSR